MHGRRWTLKASEHESPISSEAGSGHTPRPPSCLERCALLASSGDLVVVLDAEARIRLLAPATDQLLHWPDGGAVGRSLHEIVHPDDVAGLDAALEAANRDGAPAGPAVIRMINRDGGWSSMAATFHNATDGQPFGGLAVTLRDVTARRTAEREQLRLRGAIENAAREWKLTFDSIDYPIVVVDDGNHIVRLNRAAMELSGRGFPELVGRGLETLGSGEPWKAAVERHAEASRTQTAVNCQVLDPATRRTWDLTVHPGRGDERWAVISARDITGLVELERSVRRSESAAAMGRLVGAVAHEVRNPLFGVSATIDSLAVRFRDHSELATYVGVLRGELERLNHLMQDLLEYGRPRELEPTECALDEVVGEAVASCGALASERRVEVVVRRGDETPPVRVDRRRMAQVLHNLIENAILFTPADGRVTVGLDAEPGLGATELVCTVEDEGPGFSDTDLDRLFEPFYTRRKGGTGLGLSIVHRIVDQHDGSIRATNRESGGGRVTFRLQAAVRQDEDRP